MATDRQLSFLETLIKDSKFDHPADVADAAGQPRWDVPDELSPKEASDMIQWLLDNKE